MNVEPVFKASATVNSPAGATGGRSTPQPAAALHGRGVSDSLLRFLPPASSLSSAPLITGRFVLPCILGPRHVLSRTRNQEQFSANSNCFHFKSSERLTGVLTRTFQPPRVWLPFGLMSLTSQSWFSRIVESAKQVRPFLPFPVAPSRVAPPLGLRRHGHFLLPCA